MLKKRHECICWHDWQTMSIFVAKLSWLEHLQHLDHVVRLEKRAAAGWLASGNHLLQTGSRYLHSLCVRAVCSVHSTQALVSGLGPEPKSLTPQCSDTPEKIHGGGEPPGPISAT